jgi:hypothetical protein
VALQAFPWRLTALHVVALPGVAARVSTARREAREPCGRRETEVPEELVSCWGSWFVSSRALRSTPAGLMEVSGAITGLQLESGSGGERKGRKQPAGVTKVMEVTHFQ